MRPPLLAGLYNDLLWREGRRFGASDRRAFAEAALGKYWEGVGERLGHAELYWDGVLACRQAGRIACEMNRVDVAALAASLVGQLVDAVETQWREAPGFLMGAADALAWLVGLFPPRKRSDELRAEVEVMVVRLTRFCPAGSPLNDTCTGRDLLSRRDKLEELLGRDTMRASALRRAESLCAEAETRAGAGDYLSAGSFAVDAVAEFSAIGEQGRAAAAKQRARELFESAERTFKPVVASASISNDLVQDWLGSVLATEDLGGLLRLAVSSLIPSWEQSTAHAEELAEQYVLSAMTSVTTLVDGRAAARDEAGSDEISRRVWGISIELPAQIRWGPLLEALRTAGRISAQSLGEVLVAAGVAGEHNQLSMVRALEAALAGDHLVACQMLPPLVESCVRRVFVARGLDTISFRPQNGGRMQERTMGALFDDDPASALVQEAQRVLGLSLWHWYRTVMFDELGMNLRNRAAHGLLRDDECGQSTTEILLLAVVALLRVAGSRAVAEEVT